MTARRALAVVLVAAALALGGFYLFVRRLSLVSYNLAGSTEVRNVVEESMQDQKRLARLDPERRTHYRQRFEYLRRTLARIDVLTWNRSAIARRYERVLVGVVAGIVLGGVAVYVMSVRRRERRLSALQNALEALSRGDGDVVIDDGGRDLLGRISSMIERTSREVGRDRRRLQYLLHLSSWQEAARRHAHEIRTPLTAAQLELDRLAAVASRNSAVERGEIERLHRSIREELDQLREFTRNFTSFAAVGQPRLERRDLREWLDEFRNTFSSAWPQLQLVTEIKAGSAPVAIDREMLRRVLVNLCNNSALAVAADRGTVTFRIQQKDRRVLLDVEDDGPGVSPDVRARLFEPYTTTRKIGEGMGLGLAISKKIMLDHGGDLELVPSARGAVFRISLPLAEPLLAAGNAAASASRLVENVAVAPEERAS